MSNWQRSTWSVTDNCAQWVKPTWSSGNANCAQVRSTGADRSDA